jgi:hypothetical protein
MELEQIGAAPWHERLATHSHHRRFGYLVELHRLTETWLHELQLARPAHSLHRGLDPQIARDLWMLENPAERGLEKLLDDTPVNDVLARLERTIWAAQAYTLGQLLERTGTEERSVLDSILEQSSWKLGRAYAEKQWQNLSPSSRHDLRKVLLAFADTPLGTSPFTSSNEGRSFLVLRATEKEARIELHHCAHRSVYSEVQRIANELCTIHFHWTRGFAYGLHPQLRVSQLNTPTDHPSSRCGLHWAFGHVL